MRRLTAALTFSVMAACSFATSVAAQGNPAANIDDCANGPVSAPSGCALASSWGNGNLNASKAHYLEGDSVPFRLLFTNLSTSGSHQITIAWDTTKDGLHAFDYLTSFNRTETTTNPCVGVAGCSLAGPKDTEAIPGDPNITAQLGPGHQAAGVFTLFNGAITNVSAYTLEGSYSGTSTTRVTITFTATVPNPVLAFGAHVASRQDWGPGSSAATINGSPYHVSVDNLDGSGGSQDHQISTDAIYLPASITIIKDAVPVDPRDFNFTTTGGLTPAAFSLDDDSDPGLSNTQAYTGLLNFTTYTVTESPVSGWTVSFGTPPCTVTSPNGGTRSASASTVTINLKEGENVTCTFTNTRQKARLIVIKHVINDNGGTATAADFTLDSGGLEDSPDNFPGAEAPGTIVTLDPGSYNVSESGPSGYTPASRSAGCQGTIEAGQTLTCTIINDDQPARLTVIKRVVNRYGGTATAGSFTMFVDGDSPSPASFPGSETGTVVTLNAGSFSVRESSVSGYAQYSAVGCSGTLAPGESRTCTITNRDIAARLVVNKVCNPASDTGKFNLQIDSITRRTDAACGGTTGVVYVNAGTHSVGETAGTGTTLSDYISTIGGACTPGGSITLSLAQSATCTITNTRKATVGVVKTVWNPATGQSLPPSGSQAFTFQLRQGSSSSVPGTILDSLIVNSANLGIVAFATKLTPGATYALCEVVTPGWMTALVAPFYTVGDNSSICHDFTPTVGQVLTFAINNVPVSAYLTRTIGYWKNWSSCSGTGQAPKLDKTLAASEKAGISIGNLVLHGSTSTPNVAPDCAKAINTLNKTTIDGRTKMASDPAFNLAAQLLAAKLNVQAGAGVCPAAVTAINNAQKLLATVAFNGLTHGAMSTTQVNQANSLATTLDKYNNDNTLLCAAP
jgi:hypothetical protein